MAHLGTFDNIHEPFGGIPVAAFDVVEYTPYRIAGITTLNNQPASMRVVALNNQLQPIFTYMTGNDGLFDIHLFEFTHDTITMIAFDNTNTYNATIQVDITPVQ